MVIIHPVITKIRRIKLKNAGKSGNKQEKSGKKSGKNPFHK